MAYTQAQLNIADHMRGKMNPTPHDLLCFVGMIETGEATLDDFAVVGGASLQFAVYKAGPVLPTPKQFDTIHDDPLKGEDGSP